MSHPGEGFPSFEYRLCMWLAYGWGTRCWKGLSFRVLRCFTEAEVLPICLLQDEVRREMCVRVQPDHQRVLNISNGPGINRRRTCSVAADIRMSSIPGSMVLGGIRMISDG